MDAPLITLDPSANTTDVYAFVSQIRGVKYLTVALAVYPFEEPGIGPNKYNFDDNVLYEIHLAQGKDLPGNPGASKKASASVTYQVNFRTFYKKTNTIAQSFGGVVMNVNDAAQNLTQYYNVRKVDHNRDRSRYLYRNLLVPPNNQGRVTPLYNQGDNGDNQAKEGVSDFNSLDTYTRNSVFTNRGGYQFFAGQRDDGFYADIQSIFDLDFSFSGPNKPFDSQGGFNLHTLVINIPLYDIGGDQQSVGVWATTSRRKVSIIEGTPDVQAKDLKEDLADIEHPDKWVQVGRQGNPLFVEGLVALDDKDRYNRGNISKDAEFAKYALNPELAVLLNAPANLRTNRTDLAGIFIPDLIRVDLSTGPARLAGGSATGAAPSDTGFHRLGIFGGDTLTSSIQPGFGAGALPGGWPNGRRFGDDVLDIAVIAILSDLRVSPPQIFNAPNSAALDIDRVTGNDVGYNKVFPYAATPQNGRNHDHH